MSSKSLKCIAVSQQNYFELKSRGQAGDSFDGVITKLLEQTKKGDK